MRQRSWYRLDRPGHGICRRIAQYCGIVAGFLPKLLIFYRIDLLSAEEVSELIDKSIGLVRLAPIPAQAKPTGLVVSHNQIATDRLAMEEV
ncbi:MAG: hypothetical protein ACYTEL_17455 [Planctomycetota bacterium]|jgi:hypothetical protein